MASPVTLHHPKLGRTVTVPSKRSARVMREHGYKDGPAPAKAQAASARGGSNG